ncbi:serine/arginine repetitive matrix protein 1 isoform X3 [Nasonia vitripennis]|uniref:Ensconsin n=1 Tax=Nasonia vitripennis TaxID=7425 RepID=A0A7M7R200_NASVI|nr:serine/arginine repetitive matrix protein 1 isoform X3 [Nasonia vitripennis]
MFSELCRETLRKAAVCYSSGRSSASPSPSPPSSPPPSPSKEPATSSRSHHHHHHHHQPHHQQHHHHHHHSSEATIETRDVGCSSRAQSAGDHHQQDAAGGSHFSRRSTSPPEIREKRAATPTNVSSGRRTSGLESRDGRRAPYAVTVDYSSSSARESSSQQQYHSHQHHHQQYHQHHQHHYQCHRRGRSASPEMLRSFSYEEQSSQQHSPGSSPEPDDNSSTSGDEGEYHLCDPDPMRITNSSACPGAANDENGQRSSSAHNRHSLTKDLRRRSSQFDEDSLDGDHPYEHQGRESTGGGASAKDLDRAKLVRDRQNEERQRKLEELRQQALAAQKFREQREEERRKRIEELRTKDYDRRSQVEERKRLIWEAERERREAILRKNQEREARIEAKRKNERSHIVFAFGSSTPRMLEPADTGGATFWGTRRATSTTNVMMFSAAQPLTRRSSERELDGSKKRATSAGGLDRKPGEDMRMSSSMYEVFNWNCTPDPPLTPAKNKRASLSLPPTTDIFSIDDMSMIDRPMIQRGASGDDNDGTTLGTPGSVAAGCVTRYANRRRTDLMPTIPSPRESSNGPIASGRLSSAKSFTRSPGRTYSMSRLDQLAQPRRRTPSAAAAPSAAESLAASSMSRSMSHLAHAASAAKGTPQQAGQLKRGDNSRSMGNLPGSSAIGGGGGGLAHHLMLPRPTRAERLRRKAREHQNYNQATNAASQHLQANGSQQTGIRSGEATPNSPSRPHSSMSQQSGTSSVASSSVNLRPRTGTPRRPRPASIAGTGVSVSSSVERNNTTNDTKAQKDSKPPLPKVHSSSTPKKPSATSTPTSAKSASASTAERKSSAPGTTRSARASPRVTPRATPLQSPGVEHPPVLQLDPKQKSEEKEVLDEKPQQVSQESRVTEPVQVEAKKEEKPEELVAPVKEEVVEVAPQAVLPPVQQPQQQQEQQQQAPAPVVEKKEEPKVEKKSPEPEAPASGDLEEVCDMTASMIQKIRITTEEEAKAALAERRRLAREQAEREAELERQRLEEEARLEAERLRAEEEEQRRLEEETLRLAQEAREAEEQRLKAAIEEAKKREEEDRKRREEEARQKLEKEEAERKAREEAEKQRLEMVERLKKEEEERNARRKRVEAIMSRTRAKNQASNAQKGEGNDGEKSKEDSPSEENKPGPGDKAAQDLMTASLISEATQQLISNEQRAHHTDSNNLLMDELPSNNGLLRNGGHANGIADSSAKPQQQLLDNEAEELNGHHNNTNHGNGIDGQTIALDNATVKQNNVTNNLLDLSEFDTLSNSNSGPILLMQPSGVVEDSLNSNLNPTAIPFTPSFGMSNQANTNPFQDAFTNNKQDNQVPDLLS